MWAWSMQTSHKRPGGVRMVLQQQATAQAPDGVHRADCLPHASAPVGTLLLLHAIERLISCTIAAQILCVTITSAGACDSCWC